MTGPVTAVACVAFDDATDAAVLAVRDAVIRTGVRLPTRPRHRPHVTLAAVRAHRAQLPAVTDLLRVTVAGTDGFGVRLGTVGSFSRAGALWLGPDPSADLRTLQRSVRDALHDGPWPTAFTGRTEPGVWVPHVTLATRLDRETLDAVATALRADYSPVRAAVAGVAVIVVGGAGDDGLVPLTGGCPSRWPVPSGGSAGGSK